MRQRHAIHVATALVVLGLALSGETALAEDSTGRHAEARSTASDNPLVSTPATVRIGVFGLFRSRELVVAPARGDVLIIRAGSDTLTLEGSERARLRVTGGSVECVTEG